MAGPFNDKYSGGWLGKANPVEPGACVAAWGSLTETRLPVPSRHLRPATRNGRRGGGSFQLVEAALDSAKSIRTSVQSQRWRSG